MERKINYMARDFSSIKSELIGFSEKYYPEISKSFNDNSVGAWFIDLVSAVGDDLNYYIDRCYQENNTNSANLKGSLLNFARNNGIKVPTAKASMCEIKLSCELPIDEVNISQPNWIYAPVVKRGSVVGNSSYEFEVSEDVNFAEQFNKDGISNRTFVPKRSNNGVITGYTITKTTIAYGGTTKIYKKLIAERDVEPFMEVLLPEKGVLSVESVIFKESAAFRYNPRNYEFFIDEEEFMVQNESVPTFRFFEVDSLTEQYRFGSKTRYSKGSDDLAYVTDESPCQVYEDYTEYSKELSAITRTSRYFIGEWKPITQKYMVEQTDKGYTKIIFGDATTVKETNNETPYGKYIMSKIINNEMLGVLPKVGWTMYVMYRTGGGTKSNLAQGSINTILNVTTEFPSVNATDSTIKNKVTRSLSVTNITPAIGGKDEPSIEELRNLIKYNTGAQKRCVTVKDYKARVMSIPPKYGCPYRCNCLERNNKIVIPTLYITNDRKLDARLPKAIADNLVEYLSHYRNVSDYIEINSGKIYNLAFEADVFINKNYTTADVMETIMNTIINYMDVDRHDMGEDIFIGDLEKEINMLDGVISLIELRVFSIYNGNYSKDKSPLPKYIEYGSDCKEITQTFFIDGEGTESFRIGLKETDGILYSDYNSMFEILNPETDVMVRCKLK